MWFNIYLYTYTYILIEYTLKYILNIVVSTFMYIKLWALGKNLRKKYMQCRAVTSGCNFNQGGKGRLQWNIDTWLNVRNQHEVREQGMHVYWRKYFPTEGTSAEALRLRVQLLFQGKRLESQQWSEPEKLEHELKYER